MKRNILPIMVAMLFLTVPAISGLKSGEQAQSGGESVLNVMIGNDDDGLDFKKITLEKSVVDELSNKITEFRAWIETAKPFNDLKLTPEEIELIKTNINGVVDSLNTILVNQGLKPISSNWLVREFFETELGRSSIMSVGIGYAFIPFYDYETFIGIMFRPIWLLYPPIVLGGGGYTGNLNVNVLPPRIEYGDRLGSHLVRTTVFSGLYINIGDLGYDNIFGGLMILIGRARVVM